MVQGCNPCQGEIHSGVMFYWGGRTTLSNRPTLFTPLPEFILLCPLNRFSVEGMVSSEMRRQLWGHPPLPPDDVGNTQLTPPSLPLAPRRRHLHALSACHRFVDRFCLPAAIYSRTRHVNGGGTRAAGGIPHNPRTTRCDSRRGRPYDRRPGGRR